MTQRLALITRLASLCTGIVILCASGQACWGQPTATDVPKLEFIPTPAGFLRTETRVVAPDGSVDLDLPAMGADKDHQDLFVEVDRMERSPYSEFAIQEIIDAFALAPITNPDGNDGITLHVDFAAVEEVRKTRVIDRNFVDFDALKLQHYGTPTERLDVNWPNIKCARDRVFRYCLVANEIDPDANGNAPAGYAECPGNEFVVAYGGGNFDDHTRGFIFMFELGHTLGLRHGGDDSMNFKPNYVSVMNHGFGHFTQGNGAPIPLDFSREQIFPHLEENSIVEADGIDSVFSRNVYTFHGVEIGGSQVIRRIRLNGLPHDYDGNGLFSVIPQMIDLDCLPLSFPAPQSQCGSLDQLRGWNDWEAIDIVIPYPPILASSMEFI